MSNLVQLATPETSAEICHGNPRTKYSAQYKDGHAYFSLNNIHDEDTALCQQPQARNVSLNSQPNRLQTSSISETTIQVAGRTDRRYHGAEEASKNSLAAIACHNQDTQSWKEQPVIDCPRQFALAFDTTMAHYPSLGDSTPEAPVKSDQSGQRKRGRPPGSKNKPKPDPSIVPPEKRMRGRPVGSKNKPKVIGAPPAKATGANPTPLSLCMPPETNIEQNETLNHNGSALGDSEHTYRPDHNFVSMTSSLTRPPTSIQEPFVEWRPMELTNSVHDSTTLAWNKSASVVQDPTGLDWTSEDPGSSNQPFDFANWGSQEYDEDLQDIDIDAEFAAMEGITSEKRTATPDAESTNSSGFIPSLNRDLSTPPSHELGLPEAGLPEAGLPEAGLPEAGLPEELQDYPGCVNMKEFLAWLDTRPVSEFDISVFATS